LREHGYREPNCPAPFDVIGILTHAWSLCRLHYPWLVLIALPGVIVTGALYLIVLPSVLPGVILLPLLWELAGSVLLLGPLTVAAHRIQSGERPTIVDSYRSSSCHASALIEYSLRF